MSDPTSIPTTGTSTASPLSSLFDPTHSEAPLVALINTNVATMTDAELDALQKTIRKLRGVPAAKSAAITKSKKSVESKHDISELL